MATYGFDKWSTERIVKAIRRLEGMAEGVSKLARSLQRPESVVRAQLQESLARGGEATAKLYKRTGDNTWELTETEITVYEDEMLAAGESVDADAVVWADYAYGGYRFRDTACANISS